VYVLVDSRHGLKDSDIMLMEMLDEAAVPYRIVLTKADKEKQAAKTARAVEDKLAVHPAAWPQVHITSSLNKTGIEELQEMMASYCTPMTE
jgi:GTP-binding protein